MTTSEKILLNCGTEFMENNNQYLLCKVQEYLDFQVMENLLFH